MRIQVGLRVAASALVFAAFPATAAGRRTVHGPTSTEIRTAVAHAQRSRDLWATVNICNTPRHPDMIGIRAQMPSLGFTTTLAMDFQVDYWNFAHARFEPDPGVEKRLVLGQGTHGVHQGGVVFGLNPPASLSGTVKFQWLLGNRVLGRATRPTAHGVHGVDFGDPPGHSTATCGIG